MMTEICMLMDAARYITGCYRSDFDTLRMAGQLSALVKCWTT